MARSVRLYRRQVYERLERIQLKWDNLNYCRYIGQAYREINPNFTDDLDLNFSVLESIRGYTGRDLMLDTGRPDANMVNYFQAQRHRWNLDPAHYKLQLYVVDRDAIEKLKPTKKNPERSREVTYRFLRILRGDEDFRSVNKRFDDGIDGLRSAQERIQESRRVTRVDQAIEQLEEENRRIQGR